MFERFTTEAREVVVGAQRVASDEVAGNVDPLHLLTALARHTGALSALGCPADELADDLRRVRRRGGMSDADVDALSGFGIDVEHIVERVEQTHGPGALSGGRRTRRGHRPLTPEAKKVLEKSLREAIDVGSKRIEGEHLLLALTAVPGVAADVLAQRGIDHLAVRRLLEQRKAG
ncbi:Clp protease N-terminal domain-containing protein [Amycolatopsis sp. QT-25]|uniref:Clp protease N-terminal domain-containing protein n=1 Tax=Amycolatopsis sp. QT-25 TaxID=3034022 RepID=UPI0023ED57D3|nr:Clp protease N-terminal domain-containing protein [Amycolatopsis sp. QT-25]WET80069.1 Clp protease N-terminal domain-containing protein [Amycolatopsis sp. QT-25]